MPSVSKSQQRLMRAAAHTPGGFGGVSQSVGRDYVDADKRKGVRFAGGGDVPYKSEGPMAILRIGDSLTMTGDPDAAEKTMKFILANPGEWRRPRRPGEPFHSKGGKVKRQAINTGYQRGGAVDDMPIPTEELNEGDAYEQADLAAHEARRTRSRRYYIGRQKTENQVMRNEWQTEREKNRYVLGFNPGDEKISDDEVTRREGKPIELEWRDIGEAERMRQQLRDKGLGAKSYQKGGQEPEDLSDYYNTRLTPEEEAKFQAWAKGKKNAAGGDLLKDVYDYDVRGWWLDGAERAADGHGPDLFKKPNHPTFSQESIYHGSEGRRGGRWDHDETGSETLQPYDRRFDPQADELDKYDFRRQLPMMPISGFAPDWRPSYQQLAGSRDLRRGRTRTDPYDPQREPELYRQHWNVMQPENPSLDEYRKTLRTLEDAVPREPAMPANVDISMEDQMRRRSEYEDAVGKDPGNEQRHWLLYKNDMRKLDPSIKFPDEEPHSAPNQIGGYEGGGIMSGTPQWMVNLARKYAHPSQDPERSWSTTPIPENFPTVDEAEEAREYRQRYGNPNEVPLDQGTKQSTLWLSGRKLADRLNYEDEPDRGFKDMPKPTPMTREIANQMQREQLASNKGPISALGFDPSTSVVTPDAGVTVAGLTFPTRTWASINETDRSSLTHESVHKGLRDFIYSDPELRKRVDRYGSVSVNDKGIRTAVDGDELVTRALINRHLGPVEYYTNFAADPKDYRGGNAQVLKAINLALDDPEFEKLLQDIEKKGHHAGAQRLINRGQGPSLGFSRGGRVVGDDERSYFANLLRSRGGKADAIKQRAKRYKDGGVMMAKKGDVRRLGDVMDYATGNLDDEIESIGTLRDPGADIGPDNVTEEDFPTWKYGKPDEKGRLEMWRPRRKKPEPEREVPTSSLGNRRMAQRYQDGGVMMAKKGDIKTGRDLWAADPDAEYEGIGTTHSNPVDPSEKVSDEDRAAIDRENQRLHIKPQERDYELDFLDPSPDSQWYKKRKRREVPTS